MAGIGIVSSIDFQGRPAQTAFQNGVAQPAGFYYNIQDKIGFNRKALADAVNVLVADPQVTLIVTCGGLVSCVEAVINSSKNFISLLGFLPAAPFPQPVNAVFKGCVNLNSVGEDAQRIAWINVAPWNIATGNIALLYDPNTTMASREVASWPNNQAVAATNGVADPTKFGLDFAAITTAYANVKAVVISASPYFRRHMDDLISAANGSNLLICYPLQGYANANGSVQPTPGKAVAIGPELDGANGAYFKLGQMAATVLGGADPSPAIVTVLPSIHPFAAPRQRY